MEEPQTSGASGGEEEVTSTSAVVPPVTESASGIGTQGAEHVENTNGTSPSSPQAPLTGLTAASVPSLPHRSTAPDTEAATTTSTDRVPLPDLLEKNGTTNAENLQNPNRPNVLGEAAQFSENDQFAQNFDPSQTGDIESDDPSEGGNIQAFAKLEFDDGEFYMTTYAVELGRDVRVPRETHPQELSQQSELPMRRPRKRSWNSGPSSRSRKRYKEHGNSAGSVVSESGGIIGTDIPDQSDGEMRKVKPINFESASSSPHYLSRKSSFTAPKKDYNHETRLLEHWLDQHTSEKGVEDLVSDSINQLPSAEKIPLIPIHPPANANGIATGHQGISRKHVRIFFNFAEHVFQVTFFGRNGGFVDDQWYAPGETMTLVSGSIIQLKGVCIKFTLPEVPDGETGAEEADFAEGSDILFEDPIDSEIEDSDGFDENAYVDDVENGIPIFKPDEAESEDEDESEPEPILPRRKGKYKSQAGPEREPEVARPKRKGPGRPPKNGIMSKREQAQQAREARENAKAKADGKNQVQGRGKGKTAKALELEASRLQPNGKRKYTKRKKAVDIENAKRIRESTEQDDSVPPETTSKPTKDKKPIKPPRSPSPVFNEAELTPEQLAKPQSSYVVLIHEALTNSKTGQMSLPQIYRAIERRYPFFKVRVQTQGWQSSVRHNLSQHPAFTKIERDGKGWMWGLVPSVSIEKEKKRRPSPPSAPQQNYQYSNQQPRYPQHPHPYSYPNLPAQGNGAIPFPYPVPPMPFPTQLGPNGIPIPFARPQAESTYRSPYDSNPDTTPAAPSATPAANPADVVNGQHTTPTSHPPSQQHSTNPTAGPTASSATKGGPIHPTTSANTPQYSEDVLARVNAFKAALIKTLDHIPDPETLVTSVINHKLYGNPLKADPGSDAAAILKPLEDIILAGIQGRVQDSATAAGDGRTTTTTTTTKATSTTLDGTAEEVDTVAGKAADIARKIQTEESGGDSGT